MFSAAEMGCPHDGQAERGTTRLYGGASGTVSPLQLGALQRPAAVQHLRQAVDDDVEKAADAEADEQRGDDQERRVDDHLKATCSFGEGSCAKRVTPEPKLPTQSRHEDPATQRCEADRGDDQERHVDHHCAPIRRPPMTAAGPGAMRRIGPALIVRPVAIRRPGRA